VLEILAIALGGAFGALARFGLTNLGTQLMGAHFPWGTLAVNVIGSFAIGLLFIALVEKNLLPMAWRSALIVGFLGAMTTFSTFSLHTVHMIQEGRIMEAMGYVLSSVFACLLATFAGLLLGRQFWS